MSQHGATPPDAASDVDPAVKKLAKRTLKKHNSSEKPLQLAKHLTVTGGWLKEPAVVSTSTINGVEMTAIADSTGWLQQVLSGKAKGAGSTIATASHDLREQLKEGSAEQPQRERASGCSARAALGLDDDDDLVDAVGNTDEDMLPRCKKKQNG